VGSVVPIIVTRNANDVAPTARTDDRRVRVPDSVGENDGMDPSLSEIGSGDKSCTAVGKVASRRIGGVHSGTATHDAGFESITVAAAALRGCGYEMALVSGPSRHLMISQDRRRSSVR
jgi:hypothetical protein